MHYMIKSQMDSINRKLETHPKGIKHSRTICNRTNDLYKIYLLKDC